MQPMRVVMISRCPMLIEGFKRVLQESPDIAVVGVVDGSEVSIGRVAELLPSLALIDQSLSSGEQRRLVERFYKELPRLRILVASHQVDAVTARGLIAAGARGVISCNTPVPDMVTAVRHAAYGEVYLPTEVKQAIVNQMFQSDSRQLPPLNPVDSLSARELQVFELIGKGCTTLEIADRMQIGEKTVHTFRSKLRQKLGLTNSARIATEATRWVESGGVATIERSGHVERGTA